MVKFDSEKQKKIKVLSKIVSVLAAIGKIFMIIAAVFVLVAMIFIPILLNRISIKDNEITFDNESVFKLEETDNGLELKYEDSTVLVENNVDSITKVIEVISNTKKGHIIAYSECACFALIALLFLTFMVLTHTQKLFKNIHDLDTPFTLENVSLIRKVAYYLIASTALPYIVGTIFQIVSGKDLNISLNLIDITKILLIFIIAYIFEYGYCIQQDSKIKMYE